MSSVASLEVAVVLVNFNGTTDTLKCLESLGRLQQPGVVLIVVDNGSIPDESALIRAAYPAIDLVRCEVNGGWAGGNNTGIDRALERGARWVLMLNNDTVVAPELLDRLLSAVRSAPQFGIIGPVINFMEEPTVVMTDGTDFNPPGFMGFFRRRLIPLVRTEPPTITEVDIVNGCCMMVAAPVFERIGRIDERFFLIHEESDFCLRARQAGFGCGLIGEVLVWHKGSSSFRRTGQGLQRYYDARNLALLLWKHRSIHHRGRGALGSWITYLRYTYHRYSFECEHGQDAAAEAVVRGLCDALAGRFGVQATGRPWALGAVRMILELGRQLRRQILALGRRLRPAPLQN